ncbi:hypothetical protein F260042K2_06460 [Flavonifractor plautii]
MGTPTAKTMVAGLMVEAEHRQTMRNSTAPRKKGRLAFQIVSGAFIACFVFSVAKDLDFICRFLVR